MPSAFKDLAMIKQVEQFGANAATFLFTKITLSGRGIVEAFSKDQCQTWFLLVSRPTSIDQFTIPPSLNDYKKIFGFFLKVSSF